MLKRLETLFNKYFATDIHKSNDAMTSIFVEKYGCTAPIRKVSGLEIDGVQYYQFLDAATMPAGRMMPFNAFFKEIKMGASKEFLLDGLDKIADLNNKGDKTGIGGVVYIIKDALSQTPMEHYYRMASVFLFSENENPNEYDFDIAKQKIEAFKKKADSQDFWKILSNNLAQFGLNSHISVLQTLKKHQRKIDAYSLAIEGIS